MKTFVAVVNLCYYAIFFWKKQKTVIIRHCWQRVLTNRNKMAQNLLNLYFDNFCDTNNHCKIYILFLPQCGASTWKTDGYLLKKLAHTLG